MPMLVWAQEQHIEMGTALGEEVPNTDGQRNGRPASIGKDSHYGHRRFRPDPPNRSPRMLAQHVR
jgi:hypothetical protein